MALVGFITAEPDPPGVDLERWMELIAEHPRLSATPPRKGTNPFTGMPTLYHATPDSARVLIEGQHRGAISQAQDGTNQLVATSASEFVAQMASFCEEIAKALGAKFTRWQDPDALP